MAKKKDRMASVEKGDLDLKTDDDDLSVLFSSEDTEDEEYTSSPEDSATPPRSVRRPRTRLGKVWAFFRDTPPIRIVQVAASFVLVVMILTFFYQWVAFMFTPVGYIVSLCFGFLATLAGLYFMKRNGFLP